jgi:hypothetical protein
MSLLEFECWGERPGDGSRNRAMIVLERTVVIGRADIEQDVLGRYEEHSLSLHHGAPME